MGKKMYAATCFFFWLLVVVFPAHAQRADVARDVSPPSPFVKGQILLKPVPGMSPFEIADSVDARVLRAIGDGRIYLLELRAGSVAEVLPVLQGQPRVIFAEPNWLRRLHQPSDTGYAMKWDLHNEGTLCDGSDCAGEDADMDWYEAYSYLGSGFSGSAVVAVIDTGVDLEHPELRDKLVGGWDFLDGNANPADTYGHGTHVAGIAVAGIDNGADAVGVGYSPNIRVMPLRVCDDKGCPTSAIVDAIYYAANNGANVLNLSLGGNFASSSEEAAINFAWNSGLVIAASSGNDGRGRVSYPAAFANAIAVGSTNWQDRLANYSNTGSALDVVAPGGEMGYYHDPRGIFSCMPTGPVYLTTAYSYSTWYDHLQGTSMAAPQVSGLAALLFAIGPIDMNGNGKINDEIRSIIESTADDLGKGGSDSTYGWGRINVYNAILAVLAATPAPFTDIAVGSVEAPASILKGDVATVAVVVQNLGNQSVTGDIVVTLQDQTDNQLIGEQNISGLAAGSSTTLAFSWNTSSSSTGRHTLSAKHIFSDMDDGNDSGTTDVTVTDASAGITVSSIVPDTANAGTSLEVTIYGSGFADGASIGFENGSGPAPVVSNASVADATSIIALVTIKNGGAPRVRTWDVRVVNPDGASGVLADAFTVIP